MKQFLDLKSEYILETRFVANQVRENNGNSHPDWVDEKKDKAHGIQCVDQVIMIIELPDRDGYNPSLFQKVWIRKEDILSLSEKIKELDGVKLIGRPNDDLPF